jgi:DNA-directed RNA polymerase specialized sigma24 family protein
MIQDPHTLLPIAYRAATRVIRNRVLAEEAGERALHLLTLAMLQGYPPHHPEAWLRVVARRSACALLRSEWARTRCIDANEIPARQPAYKRRASGSALVRECLQGMLSPRQQDALDAALHHNSTRAAARSCGMQPRDFRRSLFAISRKAREAVRRHPGADPFGDDPAQLGVEC